MKKRVVAVLCCVMLLLGLSAAPAAADVPVGGSFQTQGAPTVTVTFTPTAMDPQTQYQATVGVDMGAGVELTSLDTVVLKVYYDVSGGATDQTEFNAAAANTQTCAVITWNSASPATLTLDAGVGTTWALGSFTPPTLTSQTGNFVINFTPGKVATETTGVTKWQLGATATDGTYVGFGSDTTPGATMNLYTEISISAAATLAWGTVPAGLDFGDGTASQKALGRTITIIANGSYDLNAQSTTPWAGGGFDANLDSNSGDGICTTAQQFALRCDGDATVADAVLVASSATQIETGTITTESGATYTSINVWLKLASTFTSANYGGTVTFTSSND